MWHRLRLFQRCSISRRPVRAHYSAVILSTFALAIASALSPTEAHAQGTLGDALSALLLSQQAPNEIQPKDLEAATDTLVSVGQLVLVELSNLPISSSAGGFVYRLNPTLGTIERASPSFGPFFTERALGSGRRGSSIGLAFRSATFNRLQGASLTDGTFPVNASRPAGTTQPNEADTIELELATRTVTAFGTYGVTDRLDVGAAVPIVTIDVEGRRVNTFRGVSSLQAAGSARASGLGDIALRSRYMLAGDTHRGVAAGLDVRLPTGREEDLLGAGKASAKMFGIGSFEGTRFGSHVNMGFGFGGVTREFSYNGALTYAVSPRVTIVGELIGRYLSNLHELRDVYEPHVTVPGVETMRWLPEDGGVNQVLVAGGMKVNIGRSYLLNANLLVRLSELGLAARVVPSLTLDYTFDR